SLSGADSGSRRNQPESRPSGRGRAVRAHGSRAGSLLRSQESATRRHRGPAPRSLGLPGAQARGGAALHGRPAPAHPADALPPAPGRRGLRPAVLGHERARASRGEPPGRKTLAIRYTRTMKSLLALLAVLLSLPVLAADAPAPVVKSPADVDFHASGSLPPGAEY